MVTNVAEMRKNNGEYVQTQWDPIHVTVMMDSEVQIRPNRDMASQPLPDGLNQFQLI